MFDESVVQRCCPREKAMMRQCRVMREMAKDTHLSGCPCEGPEDCGFIHNLEGQFFNDTLSFLKQLSTE